VGVWLDQSGDKFGFGAVPSQIVAPVRFKRQIERALGSIGEAMFDLELDIARPIIAAAPTAALGRPGGNLSLALLGGLGPIIVGKRIGAGGAGDADGRDRKCSPMQMFHRYP